jgi:hypothetical protein
MGRDDFNVRNMSLQVLGVCHAMHHAKRLRKPDNPYQQHQDAARRLGNARGLHL